MFDGAASSRATAQASGASDQTAPGASPPPRPMQRWRVMMVYAVLAAIVIPHAYEIIFQKEHWPFSNYPMWSHVIDTRDLWRPRMVGVTDEPNPREIFLERRYFEPLPSRFIDLHLNRAISAGRKGKLGPIRTFTQDYLARYEQRRLAGKNDGPKLKGLRIYEDYWLMNHDASNAAHPDRVTLLYDTDRPDAPIPPASPSLSGKKSPLGKDGKPPAPGEEVDRDSN